MEFKSILKSIVIENLDKSLAILGISMATILILVSILVKHDFLYAISGFFILLVSVIWLGIRNDMDLEIFSSENRINTKILNISFYILLCAAILSIYLRPELYVRPLSYFIIASTIFPVILLEIYYLPKKMKFNTYHLLLQIILFGLLLEFSELIIFPTSLVGEDPWWHHTFAMMIINNGVIPTNTVYSNLPIFHLEIALNSIISFLNYKYAAMFSISFLQVVIDSIFTFLIGKRIFNNKIGLFAAIMVVISNMHISLGFGAIPNTLGPSILLIIIYLLISIDSLKSKILTLLFMIIMILMHTISAFISVLTIFAGFLLTTIYSKYYRHNSQTSKINVQTKFTLTIALFFGVCMFSWWIYVSGSIISFVGILQWGFNVDNFISQPQIFRTVINTIPLSERIFDYIGLYILSALSILGCFLMLNKKFMTNLTFFLAIIGLSLLGISFTSNLLGSFIVPERWYYFAFVILSFPLATAIVILIKKIENKLLFSILSFFLAFTLIISPVANIDNHTFDPNSVFTTSLSDSELTAIYSTTKFWNSYITSDTYYGSVILHLGYKGSSMDNNIYFGDFKNQSKRLILVRTQMMTEPVKLSNSHFKVNYNIYDTLSNEGYSEVYDDGSVKGYLNLNNSRV